MPKSQFLPVFRPNRRATVDGGLRPITNGQNADDAGQMLSLVRDRDQLDDATALQDGLANLLHWCHREGIDFEAALAMARIHFAAEK